jgi:sugar phosphate isomerase/epimerase
MSKNITLGIDNVCYVHTMKSKNMNLLGFLDKAVDYGAGAVQMDPSWPSQGLDLSAKSLDTLRALLEERNLQIVVKGNSGGLGSLSNHPRDSSDDVAFFRSKIDAAASLGSPVVRIVTRAYPYPTSHTAPPPGIPRQEVIGWVIENLRGLTPHAEAKGVRLVIENHGDLRIAEIERILEEVRSPWLGVQFDLLEQVAIFEDPVQAADRLLPHAFTVHWNDAYPKLSNSGFCVAACLPGQGIIDLDGAFRKISSLGQDVFIFTAFPAESETGEDELVKAYLDDLHARLKDIRLTQ